jgi:hypothetical protein
VYKVINHDILLDKLDVCYIRGIKILQFKSYLVNRKQYVEINQTDLRNFIWNVLECIQFSYQENEIWSIARPNSLASFVFTI